jgi:hypothetical protein
MVSGVEAKKMYGDAELTGGGQLQLRKGSRLNAASSLTTPGLYRTPLYSPNNLQILLTRARRIHFACRAFKFNVILNLNGPSRTASRPS